MLTVLLAASLAFLQPSPIRVLFIGNSLTYTNDLPGMVAAIGRAEGRPITIEVVAKPDFSLEDHWQQGDARRAIARGGWTMVVLQQGPSALSESRRLLVDYAKRFAREISQAGASAALYMVWPSMARRGDFPAVSESYAAAASAVGGTLMRAGDAWREAWRLDPKLPLYGPDGFHPSRLGSQLAALVVFERLTGSPSSAGLELPGVTSRQAELLRHAAAVVAGR
jgi:hypothetical protein